MQVILDALKASFFAKKQATQARQRVERRRRSNDKTVPAVGEYITYHYLKMRIGRGHSTEPWEWLHRHGWRAATFANDRRRYVTLPADTFTKLEFMSTSERSVAIRALLRNNRPA